MKKEASIFTKAVHAGMDPKEHFGAASVPVYYSSLFAFENADDAGAIHNFEKPGYFYSRLGNPTQTALEKAVAELEFAEDSLAMASGMAAISAAVMTFVGSGDHIVALQSMYSTSTGMIEYLVDNFGVEVTYIDALDASNYERVIRDNTKLLWIETPSNPRLNITDLAAIAAIAKPRGILTMADNTFASPYNQNPLLHGIDLTIHSATKYLGGHSDLSAGVVAGSTELIHQIRHKANKYFGGAIAPQVAWLVMRGIKTLPLRMRQHNENAYAIAHILADHPKIKAVFYPGLENHANHSVAKKQMSGFGGMISFDLGGFDTGKAFMNSLGLIAIATSLGGVESVAQHSASMTHATLTKEARKKAGISEGLIRFSVGIEHRDDLIADLQQALAKISN